MKYLALLGVGLGLAGCRPTAPAAPGPSGQDASARTDAHTVATAAVDAASAPAASADARAPTPPPPAGPTGTIEGTVVIDGPLHAGPTPQVPPQFASNPACRDAALRHAQPFAVTQPGPFPGALVSALARSEQPAPHRDRVLTFTDCDITPRNLFAFEGDRILLHSDATRPHMPVITGAQGSILQLLIPRQADQERTIPGPGSYPVTARDLPPFVGANLLVLPNRFIDTTDMAGHFRITDVPVGSVEVHAWYPGTHDGVGTVTVTPNGTTQITLHLRQLPRPTPEPTGRPVDAGYPFPT